MAPQFISFVATEDSASEILRHSDLPGETILYEGGQSILLDVDHGTVPYVTSSSTGGNAVANGTGYKSKGKLHVIGVAKAYMTRVGSGPFPSQMVGDDAELGVQIRNAGKEFGTVTGRLRDIGWLDLVALKLAIKSGAIDSLALMKADILDNLATIKVVTGYSTQLGAIDRIPMQGWLWKSLKPVYKELKGWKDEGAVHNAKKFEDLPASFIEFIRFIEEETKIPVSFIGTEAERSQIIDLHAIP